jgi:hypothetical protein
MTEVVRPGLGLVGVAGRGVVWRWWDEPPLELIDADKTVFGMMRWPSRNRLEVHSRRLNDGYGARYFAHCTGVELASKLDSDNPLRE